MTYSIIGYDPLKGDLGIATASKFLAVGAVVPHAKANIGAVATQAYTNYMFGPRALEMLAKGLHPEEVLEELLNKDSDRDSRQVAIIDSKGRTAAFTGKFCIEWKGHKFGQNCVALGNILVGEIVLEKMIEAFETTQGELVDKLLAALIAGDNAGGDRRGKQSAAILVVREGGGFLGIGDRYVDLRVDDHPEPVKELKRIFELYDSTRLQRPGSRELVIFPSLDIKKLQEALTILGFYKGEIDGFANKELAEALVNYMQNKGLGNIPYVDKQLFLKILKDAKII